jgi:hypothetical protein
MSSSPDLLRLGPLGQLAQLARHLQHILAVHAADDRHHQALLGVHGHADVHVLLQHELVRGQVQAGVKLRELLERGGRRS